MMAGLFLTAAASLGLLIVADNLLVTYLYAVLSGVSSAGINTLTPIMWSSYYGRGALGSIFGVGRAAQVLGFAVGPLVSGIFFDATGGYTGAFFALAWVALAASFLIASARGPAVSRPRERRG
jgi:MFS family permease